MTFFFIKRDLRARFSIRFIQLQTPLKLRLIISCYKPVIDCYTIVVKPLFLPCLLVTAFNMGIAV